MFNTKVANALSTKLLGAPDGFLRSKQGRLTLAKALRHVRKVDGQDARLLRDNLTIVAYIR